MPAGRERARRPGRAVCPPQHCPWVQQCPASTPAPDSHHSCADGGSTAAPAPRPPRTEPAGAWCSTPERCSAVRGVAAAASVLGQNSNSASIAESLRSAVLKRAVKSQRLLCQASLNAQGLTAGAWQPMCQNLESTSAGYNIFTYFLCTGIAAHKQVQSRDHRCTELVQAGCLCNADS